MLATEAYKPVFATVLPRFQDRRITSSLLHQVRMLPVALKAVWQVGRPLYQSEIWNGGAIPTRLNLAS